MLLAPAHSFTQQARLAITLAWVAGYVNILTLRACHHVTSHVSGTVSDFGLRIVEAEWATAAFLFYLLATFFAGAVVSGIATELGRRRGWASIYVLPMALEAALLAVLALGFELAESLPLAAGSNEVALLVGVASFAMGLQNATITRISQGVVRTTHVTGVLTDLGLELVHWAEWWFDRRGGARIGAGDVLALPSSRRIALLSSILGSFALGAGLGALAFDWIPAWSMIPPVLFLVWIIVSDLRQPIAAIEPSTVVDAGLGLPASIAVFQLERSDAEGRRHRGSVHRLPDLVAWIDAVPAATRVVVLDLGGVRRLDDNAAGELRALVARMRERGMHLFLAGVDSRRFEQLRRAGAADVLHPDNVCDDLELAVARALNQAEDLAARRPRPGPDGQDPRRTTSSS
jgi:uncharacterized membrane protein YoaK (UPF0700 family)/anti-anti-sigma regulatory factor